MDIDELLKKSVPTKEVTPAPSAKGTTTKETPTPKSSGGVSLDDLVSKSTRAPDPASLTTPDNKVSKGSLSNYNAVQQEEKKPLTFLQKANLFGGKIIANLNIGLAQSISYTEKGLSFAKDVAVGATKDVLKDVKTGRVDDLALKVGQVSLNALSGIEKGLGAATDVVKGVAKGVAATKYASPGSEEARTNGKANQKIIGDSVKKELATKDAIDKGFDTISTYLSDLAEVAGKGQVNKSHIYDQLQKDDSIDKVLKMSAEGYDFASGQLKDTLAAVRTKYGRDPSVNFSDQVIQGLGQLPLFIATGAGAKVLASSIGFAESGAATAANIVNTILEAGGEAQDVTDTVLRKGGTPDQATAAGLATYGANIALIGLTNHIDGIFEESSYKGVRKLISVAGSTLGEAGQEGIQQLISNSQSGEPIMNGVKDSFLIGLIVAAPSAVFFSGTGNVDTAHAVVRENIEEEKDFVPTVEEIQKNTQLDPQQKETLTKLVNGEMTEEEKLAIVKDTIHNPETLTDKNNELTPDHPAYEALQTDVTNLLNEGVSPALIAQHLQDELNVSQEYSQNVVADAISKAQERQVELDKITQQSKEQGKKDNTAEVSSYETLAKKLEEKKLSPDIAKTVAKSLEVAVKREGTPKEKARAIDILSNPTNEASRAVYNEAVGITLPADPKAAREILTKRINVSPARTYAEQVISSTFAKTRNGYRSLEQTATEIAADKKNGVEKTAEFPKYISEELRSKPLFKEALPFYTQGIRPSETLQEGKVARVYDEMVAATDDLTARFEAEAVNVLEKPRPEAIDIPYQVAHNQITNEDLIYRDEAEAIVRKYFSADEVPVVFLDNLRTPRGTAAFGRYAAETIQMVKAPRADTAHHESVHAFLDLFVPTYDRKRFLGHALVEAKTRLGNDAVEKGIADIQKLYNNRITKERAIEIYSEEQLADGFYEYVQGRNQQSLLKTFYDKVIAFLKSFKDEADASRLYEEIIAKKRYNQERKEEAMTRARRDIYQRKVLAEQGKLSPNFQERTTRYKTAEELIEPQYTDDIEFYNKTLKGIVENSSKETAREFAVSNIDEIIRTTGDEGLEMFRMVVDKFGKTDARKIFREGYMSDTARPKQANEIFDRKLSKIEAINFQELQSTLGLRPNAEGELARPIGNARTEDVVARERFDIPNLKKVSFGGSDRDVYDLGNDMVLKVVKTARGMAQNDSSHDYYAEDSGLTPKTIEVGANYVVKEKVLAPDENTKKMVKELIGLNQISLVGNVGGWEAAQTERQKAYDIMEKYGYSGSDLANYNVLWGDVRAMRNWGTTIEGKPVLLDEGTLNGDLIKNHTTGNRNLDDADFRDVYNKSRAAKKQFGDTDSKTMYQIVNSKDFSLTPFTQLSDKVGEFKNATKENTETHALTLGTENIFVENAKIQKAYGNDDGVYADQYHVTIPENGKEKTVFVAQDLNEAQDWVKKNANKELEIPKTATVSVFNDGDTVHAIVSNKEAVELEKSNLAATTEAKTIEFYDTEGNKLETHQVTPKDEANFTDEMADTGNSKPAPEDVFIKSKEGHTLFPSYFAAINGTPTLVRNDNVSRETSEKPKKPAKIKEGAIKTSERDQITQTAISGGGIKTRKSGAFARAQSRLNEIFQNDEVNYNPIKIADQIAKAQQLIETNRAYAEAVALGHEQPPLDITDTAISVTLAEVARSEGNVNLQAEIEQARSLRQTRRGQELSMESGRVDETTPQFFIDKILARRKENAATGYKPLVSARQSFAQIFEEKSRKEKSKAVKQLSDALVMKSNELDSFLADIAC